MSKEMDETLWGKEREALQARSATSAPAVYRYGSVVRLDEERTLAAAQERLERLRGLARMRPWDAELAAMVDTQEAKVKGLERRAVGAKPRREAPAAVVEIKPWRREMRTEMLEVFADELARDPDLDLPEVWRMVHEFNKESMKPLPLEVVDEILQEVYAGE